jgi:NAD(P)-dependent dehydrogenase (short-subunit alcohol dehydrogenase family)
VLVGRSPDKYRAVQSELDGMGASHALVVTDLGQLSSVAAAARMIRDEAGRGASILINNAATAGKRGVTHDGFELAFGVNYVAHFLLTSLLMELALPITRVVNVTSNAHYSTPKLDPGLALGKTRSLMGWREYSHSKAALAALAVELAERKTEITSLAVHPGLVATGLWRRIPQPFRAIVTRRMVPPDVGALHLVRAATDPSLPSGGYLAPEGLTAPGRAVLDESGRAMLWDASRRWVEKFLSPTTGGSVPFGL